jgi:hypothetical protein
MNEIEIVETCVGSDIIIDGESVRLNENDERSEEYVRQLKLKLIGELSKVVDQISSYDLQQIAEIVATNGYDWVYDDEKSSKHICDHCGNYNFNEVYKKIETGG